ncbi:hypothetical protein A6E15_14010 [Natrinema saccharevitans]|uniref:DUF309 domain-containing protein n=1 Tax=Natrinema saccharevitans TaxID=301967 RepID=A0A1S8B079_9EURY|nr:DUF309 domain-containing protein [Natrinema saccharevitans]OLZ42024.1 hypothetical protein A6E15_14010 [Natrinema saccharevitans]
MRDHLRAGAAIFNAGHYHAAHDAWEDRWLDLESGSHDERLLHGLIQYSGAVHHAGEHNWEGAVGLAESGGEYLAGLPADYRDLGLDSIRTALSELAADPERIERGPPVPIEHEGDTPSPSGLAFEPTAIAAVVFAEEFGYDPEPVARAREYAEAALAAGEDDSRFITLVFDFVREDEHRGIIYQRLTDHVGRRRAREEDVEELF